MASSGWFFFLLVFLIVRLFYFYSVAARHYHTLISSHLKCAFNCLQRNTVTYQRESRFCTQDRTWIQDTIVISQTSSSSHTLHPSSLSISSILISHITHHFLFLILPIISTHDSLSPISLILLFLSQSRYFSQFDLMALWTEKRDPVYFSAFWN